MMTDMKKLDLDNGDWLNQLLLDIQQDVLRQPTPGAVERIRSRLLREMRVPTKAAA